MAEIRINATGGLKLYDADDSHYAQIIAGTITSNTDVMTLGHNVINIPMTTASSSATTGALTIGGGLGVAADLYVGDDAYLITDSAVLGFGADKDTTLTHTDGTGLTLNSTNKLTFGDAASYINQSSDGVLTIAGEATIDLTASTAVLVSNDLKLDSDSSVIGFGADNDTTLTHTDGTGLTLNSTNKICFNDASQFIQGSSNAILALGATDEIDLTATAVDLNGTLDVSGESTFNDSMKVIDDKGIVFGTNGDWFLGADDGEVRLSINKGSSQGQGTNEGTIEFVVGDNAEQSSFFLTGGEEGSAVMYLSFDQGDDAADLARIHMTSELIFSVYTDGAWDAEFKIGDDAVTTEHDITTATFDYAEFFEWKTELANDAKITETYGLTVVLDNNKVRLAEAGEEADVIGVVRPNGTSSFVGGNGIYWKNRYKKNVWGEDEKEAFTQVNWHILNEHGNSIKHHSYMKDRIPQYELIDSPKQDDKNWHLLDSNFKKDGEGNKTVLVVPSTDEEKAASRYTERTTHRQTGKPLMRRIFDSSYDSSLTYVDRKERRKEWCIVGLLGQVPIRDTAVIPTSWKKMKNLESGLDLYFIK